MKKKKSRIITSDDILGKEAVDPEGSILGVITKVHIDKKSMKVTGVTIDMGLLKPDLFVGAKYLKHLGADTVLLKRVPHDKYRGLKVLTEGGEIIGKVKHIVTDRKKIKEFVISTKKLWDSHYSVTYKDIKEIGDSIILKSGSKPKKKRK